MVNVLQRALKLQKIARIKNKYNTFTFKLKKPSHTTAAANADDDDGNLLHIV